MTIRLKNPDDFKIAMIKKGFSQRSLGKNAGVSDTTINHLLNEKRGCGPHVASKICEALKTDFDDIFFIDSADNCNQDAAGTKGSG